MLVLLKVSSESNEFNYFFFHRPPNPKVLLPFSHTLIPDSQSFRLQSVSTFPAFNYAQNISWEAEKIKSEGRTLTHKRLQPERSFSAISDVVQHILVPYLAALRKYSRFMSTTILTISQKSRKTKPKLSMVFF